MARKRKSKYIDPQAEQVAVVSPPQRPINPDVSAGFSSLVLQAFNVLTNPDIAYRTDRRMSEQMIRDPMIAGPLMKRMLATAQLEWQILPEDEEDESQIQVAEEIQKIIARIPRFCDFKSDLLWATWYGTGVSELFWGQDDLSNQWCIEKHRPHRGDKFVYDIYGNPRLMVKNNQAAGRELTKSELDRLVIHVFRPEDGSFYEGAEAGYLFKGRGLRDYIWAYWWLKHNALRFWLDFMERFGGGMVLGKYPMNNPEAKAAIESVLKNLINGSRVSVPVPTSAEDPKTYGIEVVTVAGASAQADLFKNFIDDWAGKHIRILIEGQEQAQQTSGDGMGSGRADALQDMFRSLRNFDATCLQDTLTDQLVTRVQRYNFGELPFKCRFEFVLDEEDYEVGEKRVKAAKEVGIDVSMDWVYDTLGIPRPKDGDDLLEFGAQAEEQRQADMQPKGQQFADYSDYLKRYAEALVK